jgi:hypothetical protein
MSKIRFGFLFDQTMIVPTLVLSFMYTYIYVYSYTINTYSQIQNRIYIFHHVFTSIFIWKIYGIKTYYLNHRKYISDNFIHILGNYQHNTFPETFHFSKMEIFIGLFLERALHSTKCDHHQCTMKHEN